MLLDLGESLTGKQFADSNLHPFKPAKLQHHRKTRIADSPSLYQILSEEKQLPYEQFLSMLQAESDVFLFFLLDGYNEISSETAKINSS